MEASTSLRETAVALRETVATLNEAAAAATSADEKSQLLNTAVAATSTAIAALSTALSFVPVSAAPSSAAGTTLSHVSTASTVPPILPAIIFHDMDLNLMSGPPETSRNPTPTHQPADPSLTPNPPTTLPSGQAASQTRQRRKSQKSD
ncbi:MAG: hypothetical protein M1840_005736 [Geoglossum simile]|nr:MAG: hypothetical protein M1840_005736 [Geoglossum simile]